MLSVIRNAMSICRWTCMMYFWNVGWICPLLRDDGHEDRCCVCWQGAVQSKNIKTSSEGKGSIFCHCLTFVSLNTSQYVSLTVSWVYIFLAVPQYFWLRAFECIFVFLGDMCLYMCLLTCINTSSLSQFSKLTGKTFITYHDSEIC